MGTSMRRGKRKENQKREKTNENIGIRDERAGIATPKGHMVKGKIT